MLVIEPNDRDKGLMPLRLQCGGKHIEIDTEELVSTDGYGEGTRNLPLYEIIYVPLHSILLQSYGGLYLLGTFAATVFSTGTKLFEAEITLEALILSMR